MQRNVALGAGVGGWHLRRSAFGQKGGTEEEARVCICGEAEPGMPHAMWVYSATERERLEVGTCLPKNKAEERRLC
eukprot:10449760-Alexandrium_andersonii.AAC.1